MKIPGGNRRQEHHLIFNGLDLEWPVGWKSLSLPFLRGPLCDSCSVTRFPAAGPSVPTPGSHG